MPLAARWVGLEISIVSEARQRGQISYDITYMWHFKNDTNELLQNRNRLTDLENKFTVTKEKRWGEG